MNPTTIERDQGATTAEAERLPALIDCDVHPTIRDQSVLAPRMSKRVARRIFGSRVSSSRDL